MGPATDTGAVAQPLDEARDRRTIGKMVDSEWDIIGAHPCRLDSGGAGLQAQQPFAHLKWRQRTAQAPMFTPSCGYFEAWQSLLIKCCLSGQIR